jgi:hypothetical protein
MWYLYFLIKRLLSKNMNRHKDRPFLKRDRLGNLIHVRLFKKSMIYVLIMLIIFTGGYLFNHYYADTDKKPKTDMEIVKEYFSKVAIIVLFFCLHYFMNRMNLFVYKFTGMGEMHFIPNNGMFWVFVILVLILLFGFLLINSKLVPEQFRLGTKFPKLDGNVGDYIMTGIISFNAFYVFWHILFDPSRLYYILFLALSTTIYFLKNKSINIWIVFAYLSLCMMNNFPNIMDVDISKGWELLHHLVHSFQIAFILFGLIKEKNYNFFSG